MAIDLTTQYPGKVDPASASYPYGEPRNITTPSDGTGTPWEQAIIKDTEGLKQALLSMASIVPSGTPEAVAASQYFQALIQLASGRAIFHNDIGLTDAYVVQPLPGMEFAGLFPGLTIQFFPNSNNTGPATIDYDGTVSDIVNDVFESSLQGGELSGGVLAEFTFNGDEWSLKSIPLVYRPELAGNWEQGSPVILTEPEVLGVQTQVGFAEDAWINSNIFPSTTLFDASAVAAMVRIVAIRSAGAATDDQIDISIRKAGTTPVNGISLQAGSGACSVLHGGTAILDTTVTLNTAQTFEFFVTSKIAPAIENIVFALIGYYVGGI